ncbi:MAG: prepilin-type N-terminal cleavage/methylation domain-containing protein [Patescibacteria group bacterium]
MSKIPTNHRGISIIEALIAIAILLIGILSIARIFPLATKISRSAEETTIAANLAQNEIETLFSLGYDGLGTGLVEAKHRLATDPSNPFYAYQRQTDVSYVDANLSTSTSDTGLKKVTVTVFWRNPATNNEKSYPMIVLISQK